MGAKAVRGTDAVSKACEDALACLLTDEGVLYHDITTTQLCHKAVITRQTFYRHFSDIDDVLDALAARQSAEFLRELKSSSSAERSDGAHLRLLVYRFMEGRKDLLRALKQSGMLARFLDKFWEAGGTAWAISTDEEMDLDKYLLYTRYSTSCISVLINEWVDDETSPTPEDMLALEEELIRELGHVLSVIAADDDSADATDHAGTDMSTDRDAHSVGDSDVETAVDDDASS